MKKVLLLIAGVIIFFLFVGAGFWVFKLFQPPAPTAPTTPNDADIVLAPTEVEDLNTTQNEEEAMLGNLAIINIENGQPQEKSIIINDGDTVMWLNRDETKIHFEGLDDSVNIDAYTSYTKTIIAPGTYTYTLESDSGTAQGEIIVED